MGQAPLVYDLNRFPIVIQPDRSQVFAIYFHKNPSLGSGFRLQKTENRKQMKDQSLVVSSVNFYHLPSDL
jgi:hypothetical protein